MTETQGPSATDEHESTRTDPPPGVDRSHLRSYEQLRRSTTDRKVAGVAGGLGRHLDIDPTVVRVLLVVLCFFGGAGFLLYGVAWLLVPEDGRLEGKIATGASTRNGLLVAAAVVAAVLAVSNGWGGIGFPWPVLLVGVGVLVYLAVRDKSPSAGQGRPPAPSYGPPAASYEPSTGTTYAEQPPAPPWLPSAPAATAYQPPPPRRGPRLFGFTLAMVAVALGSLGLYDVSGGDVLDSAYPALALAVVGVMLVVGAFIGRAGGLVLLGILAALALAVTSIASNVGGFRGGEGEQLDVAPASAARLADSYFVPRGRIVLDLSDVRNPSALAGRSIDVGARAGEVVVILPDGVVSDVRAEVTGPGQIDLPDRSSGGIGSDLDGSYGTGAGTFSVRAHLFAGHIDVRNP